MIVIRELEEVSNLGAIMLSGLSLPDALIRYQAVSEIMRHCCYMFSSRA